LRVIEKLPHKVAVLSLEPGARLCTDFVVTEVATDKELYVGLAGGSGVYVTRVDALRELVRLCLGTYSSFMYFHLEDMEFVIKLWLMGYVTVSYRGIKLTHFGRTSQQKPLYRRYTEYLGPVIAVLVNVPSRFLIIGLPLRALRDFVKSMTKNEIVLLLRAYLFALRNLKHIMVHRFFRFKKYRAQSVFAKILCNCIK
jgi:GT2 family glycosyltransferase